MGEVECNLKNFLDGIRGLRKGSKDSIHSNENKLKSSRM
jgi:hypothetical protein